MNEIEKAIEILNDPEADMEYSTGEIIGANLLAISSLEKQIPKKIIYQEYEYNDEKIRINGIDGVPYDLCPNCKTNLCTTGFFARKKMNYCPDCGQRLDWSK
jgi:hypothetical protein